MFKTILQYPIRLIQILFDPHSHLILPQHYLIIDQSNSQPINPLFQLYLQLSI